MKLEKIEGINPGDVVKIVKASEVEGATRSGWRLLGTLESSGATGDTPFGNYSRYEISFVLLKTKDEEMAALTNERDAAVKKAQEATTRADRLVRLAEFLEKTEVTDRATKDEIRSVFNQAKRLAAGLGY
jgi:hypothetical protein